MPVIKKQLSKLWSSAVIDIMFVIYISTNIVIDK